MSSSFFKMPEKIFGVSSSLIKLFLLPLGIVVAFLVSLGLVILPKFESISKVNSLIKTTKNQIKSVAEKKAYLMSVDQEELSKNESYLSSAVLQEKNSYLLVGVVRSIADKYGFQVKSFSINPIKIKEESESSSVSLLKVATKDVATKMPINVTLSGPEEKSLDLVKAMENSLPILFIDNFDISTRFGVSELELLISSYYIPDKTDLVSGNLTLADLQPTKEETDLLNQISQFDRNESLIQSLKDQSAEEKSFVKYERENPFTL